MAEDATQQPISDDQELAKVLAGVSGQTDQPAEEVVTTPAPVVDDAATQQETDDAQAVAEPQAEMPEVTAPEVAPVTAPAGSGELDSIKMQALSELRPLVDKLDVSPEERFDTYLLLLRSTDDKALIAPAHDAAVAIADEARRAQALLDIIKEIDFLSQNQK